MTSQPNGCSHFLCFFFIPFLSLSPRAGSFSARRRLAAPAESDILREKLPGLELGWFRCLPPFLRLTKHVSSDEGMAAGSGTSLGLEYSTSPGGRAEGLPDFAECIFLKSLDRFSLLEVIWNSLELKLCNAIFI